MNDNEFLNLQLVDCPFCAGREKKCRRCGQSGRGIFYEESFLFWGEKISRTEIKKRRARAAAGKILDLVAYLLGLAGLGALGYWLILSGEEASIFYLFREKNLLALLFWLGLLGDLFVFYRLAGFRSSRLMISRAFYSSPKKETGKEARRAIDASLVFSWPAKKAIERSFSLADRLGQSRVEPLHLFFTLLADREVAALFSRLNVDLKILAEKVKNQISLLRQKQNETAVPEAGKGEPVISEELLKIFLVAYLEAVAGKQEKVETVNFIAPLLLFDQNLAEICYDLKVTAAKARNVASWFSASRVLAENYRRYRRAARFKPKGQMNRAYTAIATPITNHFGLDLTLAARQGRLDYCLGREKEIASIFQALESGHNGLILVGERGVGKSTIIAGLAVLMAEENVPKILKDKRLIEIEISRLASGANPAEAEGRLLAVIDEAAYSGNIVLYFDNIEDLVGISAGREESLDLSEVLAKAAAAGRIICLAAASAENYRKFIKEKALGGVLDKIEVNEPEKDEVIRIIEVKAGYLENRYKIYFSYEALEQIVELTAKYVHDKFLPAKAVDALEAVAVKIAKEKKESKIVTRRDAEEILSGLLHIPLSQAGGEESGKLLKLEELIHEHLIDQEEAVKAVAASLRRARAQLSAGRRPLANLLFLGPTGVGKTELAKTVARVYFGGEEAMIRLDMSEYGAFDGVVKMIGDSAGNKGYLTEAARERPFSLLLLDEFEKAHSDVLNLFLQVMEDGRLTDGGGRTVDFTNSIIIATSNIGALYIQEALAGGAAMEKIKESLINEHLNKILRPELINRFDGVIVFKPLGRTEMIAVARLMLYRLGERLELKGIGLKAEEEGIKKLARDGYDPKFGARPLRRLILEKVENEIANKILAGEVARRDKIVIDKEGTVKVEKGRRL